MHRVMILRALGSDVRRLYRQLGFRIALAELVNFAARRIAEMAYASETQLVMVKTLAPSDDAREVELERIREDHASELIRLRVTGHPFTSLLSMQIRDNLRRGYQGFVVRRDGAGIGYFWWADGRANPTHPDFARFRIDLLDDDVYGFQYFVAPTERGGGVATSALGSIETELARLGYRRVWGLVDATNTPARWLYTISGWTVVHAVRCVRLLTVERQSVV